jgi:threonine/homoserine/homoserine lactone efflux protein
MLHHLLVFAIASAVIAVVPGPDILYIVGRGIAQGRPAALASAVGLNAGAAVHVSLAALGLAALIRESETALLVLRYAGAAYLVYLAIKTILRPLESPKDAAAKPGVPIAALFAQGMITDLLNPKVYLFFLALFPQFIDPSKPYAPQVLVLGVLFLAINVPIDLTIAWFSGVVGEVLGRRPRAGRALRWISATVLLGLAGRVAVTPDS